MANKFRIEFEDGAKRSASVKIKAPKDIVMFVAGTTDPINLTGENHQANNKYWKDSLDNFWGGVKKLKPQYLDLHIEDTFFSWSGDNDTSERNKAAERLLDLFLRVYSNWTKKEVHLHLIGHSHGGNVMNQFTETIAKDKNFPELWSIKSLTYLSTPFFQEKHQIVHDKIHPDCRVMNVHNEYDITQRFVADFSLYNLETILSTFNSDKVTKATERINLVLSSNIFAQMFEKFSYIDDDDEGPLIWERTALLINNVGTILDEVIGCVNNLKSSLSAEKANLLTIFNRLRAWATATEVVLNSRNSDYGTLSWIDDLNYLVVFGLLNQLLAIDGNLESSFLLGVLAGVFAEDTGLTDSIDDTAWNPDSQINGKYKIDYLNITTKDRYHSRGKKSNYEGFATGVEGSVKEKNLREVLMRLFSQFIDPETIDTATNKIKKITRFIVGRTDTQLKLLRGNLIDYNVFIRQFNADLIAEQDQPVEVEVEEEDIDSDIVFTPAARAEFNQALATINNTPVKKEKAEDGEEHEPIPGSVPYLAMVSHGLSHTQFWEEVEEVLRAAFSSGENPGYKG